MVLALKMQAEGKKLLELAEVGLQMLLEEGRERMIVEQFLMVLIGRWKNHLIRFL
jgi:hypothetical protein